MFALLSQLKSLSIDNFEEWAGYHALEQRLLKEQNNQSKNNIFEKMSDDEFIEYLINNYLGIDNNNTDFKVDYEYLSCIENIEYIIDMSIITKDFSSLLEICDRKLDELPDKLELAEIVKKHCLESKNIHNTLISLYY